MTRSGWARRPSSCWRRCGRSPARRPRTTCRLFRSGRRAKPAFRSRFTSIPGPGADVSIPDTVALAQLPRVEFIKESSRDLARVSRLIVEIDRAGHARYFTTMQMLLVTLILGGSGATMPPPAAEIARHVIDCISCQGLRTRRRAAAAVRAVPVQMDAPRARAGDESRDEPDRRRRRRALPALLVAHARRNGCAGRALEDDRAGQAAIRSGRRVSPNRAQPGWTQIAT